MQLVDWLKGTGTTQAAFAKIVGVTPGRISQLAIGNEWPSKELAARIREATDGQVTADDFLPEVEGPKETEPTSETAERIE